MTINSHDLSFMRNLFIHLYSSFIVLSYFAFCTSCIEKTHSLVIVSNPIPDPLFRINIFLRLTLIEIEIEMFCIRERLATTRARPCWLRNVIGQHLRPTHKLRSTSWKFLNHSFILQDSCSSRESSSSRAAASFTARAAANEMVFFFFSSLSL